MDLSLAGKVALVTGATGGIGAAVAHRLAGEGASCVLVARRREPLEALAADLGGAHLVAADVTDESEAARVVEAARGLSGRIDVLVTAAGSPRAGSFWDLGAADWETGFDKVRATVSMLRAVVPVMRGQGAGRVVTVAGETGRQPRPGLLPGAAANAAVLAVTKGVALEVASDGVAVNAVNPGPTRTPRLEALVAEEAARRGLSEADVVASLVADCPAGVLAEPDDVARAITFLVSEAATHLTGEAVTVDGARTRGTP